MLYADDLVLASGTCEGTKGRLEAWKGVLKSKASRVNIKKANMMISNGNAENDTEEGKFPNAVYKIGVGSNSILCQFC